MRGWGLAKLGKLGFHVKELARRHFIQKFYKKLRKSCTKVLQSFLYKEMSVLEVQDKFRNIYDQYLPEGKTFERSKKKVYHPREQVRETPEWVT